ncbi:outer membrane receptor protein involved in Fe transport [Sphingobium sp. B1D7B]|uniref:TonB-dependent receptor domain-containing protein n=1 Tax=Sphingobium sp. B1D7B TaxID=2940578 RepID=UPI002225085E|nr:TonB-dependent receptor [Sphingobium sp. B1D7B]MCW2404592.1 outer membrane receptor protein involved in Fe transport [Sphingobium sp. B1D7B]
MRTIIHVRAGASVLAIMSLIAMTAAQPASAQVAAQDDAEGSAESAPEQAIVVTGTRLGGGFNAPTPVTSIGSERLEALGINNVGEALNQLPSFRASSGPAAQANLGGYIGARLLDLRGLEPQRTLVLVDGKRFVPSTVQGSVDTNLIPSSLLKTVDVVTGGASAAYGSDAVAGVVNFILDRRKTGLDGEFSAGVSQRGDDGNLFASLSGGMSLGDRIHVIAAVEYEKLEGLGDCTTRSWCNSQTLILGNTPGAGGQPANLIVPGVNTSTMSPGGLINRSYNAAGAVIGTTASDPLRGTKFLADGTPGRFQYGTLVGPLFMLGGEGQGRNGFVSSLRLKVPLERVSTYGALTADLSDDVTLSADVSYGRVKGTVEGAIFRDFNGTLLGRIKRDNPFIPQSVQTAMDANGVASFILGKASFDLGPGVATSTTETYRGVLGLEARLSDRWTLNGFYQYGRTNFTQSATNLVNLAKLGRAVDAVQSGGNAICRVNADASTTNDDPACVAFNPFGEGRYSAAAAAYITDDGFQRTVNDQHVVGLDVRGELFDLPAGPVSVAVGGEYRRDKVDGTADPVSAANGFYALNGSALSGAVTVKEVFGEIAVPVLRDSALGAALDLNGAIRRTDYSTTGAVTTWKAGLVYEPIDGLRLRGTRSRDIRAPNIFELFGPQTLRSIGLSDPLNNGLQTNPFVLTGSNPDLSVETADSWTGGVVITPRGGALQRMKLSVDYYNIKVAGAIGALGAQTLVNRCAQGATTFCNQITRDANNQILQVRDVILNSNALKTSGFDIELQYRQPLGGWGDLNAQLIANVTQELTTVDSLGAVDRAGQTGVRTGTIPGVPDYVLDGVVTLTAGKVQLTGHGRYIPSGIYWTNFIGPDQDGYSITLPNSVDNNRVPARFYLDLTARVNVDAGIGRTFQLFATVNNVLDRDPPSLPGPSGGTNQILFDPVGRAFKVGARFHFGG